MPLVHVNYYSRYDDEYKKLGKSFIEIEDKSYPLGPPIGKGNYGEVLACTDFIVVKKIKYACKDKWTKKHWVDLEEYALMQIYIEYQIFQARYHFCQFYILPGYLSVLVMLKIPGTPLYNSKTKKIHPAIASEKEFSRTYIKMLLQVYFLNTVFEIVHGDLNFTNFLEDEAGHVHIVDFGFARFIKDSIKTPGKCGHYFAPELKHPIAPDPAQDVYRMGKMFQYYDDIIDPELKPFEKNTFYTELAKKMCYDKPEKRITILEAFNQCVDHHKLRYPEDDKFLVEINQLHTAGPSKLRIPQQLLDFDTSDDIICSLKHSFNPLVTLKKFKKQYELSIKKRVHDLSSFIKFINLFPPRDQIKAIEEIGFISDYFIKIIGDDLTNLTTLLTFFAETERIHFLSQLDNAFLQKTICKDISYFNRIIQLLPSNAQIHFIKKVGKETLSKIPLEKLLTDLSPAVYKDIFQWDGQNIIMSQLKSAADLFKIWNILPLEHGKQFLTVFCKELIGKKSISDSLPAIDSYLKSTLENSFLFKKNMLLKILDIYKETLETRLKLKSSQHFWAQENTSFSGYLIGKPTLTQKIICYSELESALSQNHPLPACTGAMNDGTLKTLWDRANILLSSYPSESKPLEAKSISKVVIKGV